MTRAVTHVVVLLLLLVGCAPQPELPVLGNVPGFALTESSGREVSSQELAGKVWIADFIFTSCGGTCPLMTGKMKTLHDELPSEIRFVSFTVDPATDTPAVLAEYAKRFQADPNRWWFLTGTRDSLYTLSIQGFKLGVDDTMGTESEPITHSSRFVLVDQRGRIRGYYGMDDETALDRLAQDARSLL